MDPVRWQQIDKLLGEALDQEPGQRRIFLEQACAGDEELRNEVEALLEAHEKAGSFVERPALDFVAQQPRQLLVGMKLGPYEILSLIGRGGMGEVYQARDTRLDRMAALKILPAEVAADPDRLRRFVREAKAASALNHPNIATIYEIGRSDGIHWIAMELVEGQTLAERMKDRPLEMDEILDIGIQAAEGLEAAHKKGIIHRDIKPANLMLTPEGRVKILDFGLAKRTRWEGQPARAIVSSETHTFPGMIMGTARYMSPEQVLGQPVDHRTDIFSLGVMLYEMATGQPPFAGETPSAIFDAIVHQTPAWSTRAQARIPEELRRIIQKVLEKFCQMRYPTASDLGADLKQLKRDSGSNRAAATEEHLYGVPVPEGRKNPPRPLRRALGLTGIAMGALALLVTVLAGLNVGGLRDRFLRRSGAAKIESLAVLPLANLSGDPEQEYFADGMTEALITELGKLSSLRVISRQSAMMYKNAKKSLPEIARELNVDGVVEGTVARSGERVRISAQLLDARRDQQLWAESFERDLRDVLALQSEVARAISMAIRLKLTTQEQALLGRSHPIEPEAYEFYLKGRHHEANQTVEDFEKAIDLYQQAISRDPTFAMAYSGLADSMIWLAWGGTSRPEEMGPKVKAAALKALQLDDSLAEAHTSLALAQFIFDWDWVTPEYEFRKALALNQALPRAHYFYFTYLGYGGRFDEAIIEAKKARELDPLSVFMTMGIAWAYRWSLRFEDSIYWVRKAQELSPDYPLSDIVLGLNYNCQSRHEEALAACKRSWVQFPPRKDFQLDYLRALVMGRAGAKNQVKELLAYWLNESKYRYLDPLGFARFYLGLEDKEGVFKMLEQGYQGRSPNMVSIGIPLSWDLVRDDPRFQVLLQKIGFPQRQRAK